MSTSNSTQLLSSDAFSQCCLTSTETVRTTRDREPRTSTSTFTQFLSSEILQVECCFTSTDTVGTIRNVHLDFYTVPELEACSVLLYVHTYRRYY